MNDTVKLVIEMPKEDYEFTKGARTARYFPAEYYVELILKSVPLDDILSKIRAEIEGIITEETVMDNSGGEYEHTESRLDSDDALKIIDEFREEYERKVREIFSPKEAAEILSEFERKDK